MESYRLFQKIMVKKKLLPNQLAHDLNQVC